MKVFTIDKSHLNGFKNDIVGDGEAGKRLSAMIRQQTSKIDDAFRMTTGFERSRAVEHEYQSEIISELSDELSCSNSINVVKQGPRVKSLSTRKVNNFHQYNSEI